MIRILATSALLLSGYPGWLSAGARLQNPRHYHIVLPSRPIQPGETILARLEPEPPPDVRVTWRFFEPEGLHRNWVANEYRAPYVIKPDHPPIQVGVSLWTETWNQKLDATLNLSPGSVPGTEDCLGHGQSFYEWGADIVNRESCSFDEIPQLIHRAEPVYPPSSFARGSEDTIFVHVLVCKTGTVLDAYAPALYPDLMSAPIERDPKLLAAAVDAAKRSEFSPGACAAWWSIPFLFHR